MLRGRGRGQRFGTTRPSSAGTGRGRRSRNLKPFSHFEPGTLIKHVSLADVAALRANTAVERLVTYSVRGRALRAKCATYCSGDGSTFVITRRGKAVVNVTTADGRVVTRQLTAARDLPGGLCSCNTHDFVQGGPPKKITGVTTVTVGNAKTTVNPSGSLALEYKSSMKCRAVTVRVARDVGTKRYVVGVVAGKSADGSAVALMFQNDLKSDILVDDTEPASTRADDTVLTEAEDAYSSCASDGEEWGFDEKKFESNWKKAVAAGAQMGISASAATANATIRNARSHGVASEKLEIAAPDRNAKRKKKKKSVQIAESDSDSEGLAACAVVAKPRHPRPRLTQPDHKFLHDERCSVDSNGVLVFEQSAEHLSTRRLKRERIPRAADFLGFHCDIGDAIDVAFTTCRGDCLLFRLSGQVVLYHAAKCEVSGISVLSSLDHELGVLPTDAFPESSFERNTHTTDIVTSDVTIGRAVSTLYGTIVPGHVSVTTHHKIGEFTPNGSVQVSETKGRTTLMPRVADPPEWVYCLGTRRRVISSAPDRLLVEGKAARGDSGFGVFLDPYERKLVGVVQGYNDDGVVVSPVTLHGGHVVCSETVTDYHQCGRLGPAMHMGHPNCTTECALVETLQGATVVEHAAHCAAAVPVRNMPSVVYNGDEPLGYETRTTMGAVTSLGVARRSSGAYATGLTMAVDASRTGTVTVYANDQEPSAVFIAGREYALTDGIAVGADASGFDGGFPVFLDRESTMMYGFVSGLLSTGLDVTRCVAGGDRNRSSEPLNNVVGRVMVDGRHAAFFVRCNRFELTTAHALGTDSSDWYTPGNDLAFRMSGPSSVRLDTTNVRYSYVYVRGRAYECTGNKVLGFNPSDGDCGSPVYSDRCAQRLYGIVATRTIDGAGVIRVYDDGRLRSQPAAPGEPCSTSRGATYTDVVDMITANNTLPSNDEAAVRRIDFAWIDKTSDNTVYTLDSANSRVTYASAVPVTWHGLDCLRLPLKTYKSRVYDMRRVHDLNDLTVDGHKLVLNSVYPRMNIKGATPIMEGDHCVGILAPKFIWLNTDLPYYEEARYCSHVTFDPDRRCHVSQVKEYGVATRIYVGHAMPEYPDHGLYRKSTLFHADNSPGVGDVTYAGQVVYRHRIYKCSYEDSVLKVDMPLPHLGDSGSLCYTDTRMTAVGGVLAGHDGTYAIFHPAIQGRLQSLPASTPLDITWCCGRAGHTRPTRPRRTRPLSRLGLFAVLAVVVSQAVATCDVTAFDVPTKIYDPPAIWKPLIVAYYAVRNFFIPRCTSTCHTVAYRSLGHAEVVTPGHCIQGGDVALMYTTDTRYPTDSDYIPTTYHNGTVWVNGSAAGVINKAPTYLTVNASVHPGDSGLPALDEFGDLVGVVTGSVDGSAVIQLIRPSGLKSAVVVDNITYCSPAPSTRSAGCPLSPFDVPTVRAPSDFVATFLRAFQSVKNVFSFPCHTSCRTAVYQCGEESCVVTPGHCTVPRADDRVVSLGTRARHGSDPYLKREMDCQKARVDGHEFNILNVSDDHFLIDRISHHGDSGTPVFDPDGALIGLLVGANAHGTVVQRPATHGGESVLSDLNITFYNPLSTVFLLIGTATWLAAIGLTIMLVINLLERRRLLVAVLALQAASNATRGDAAVSLPETLTLSQFTGRVTEYTVTSEINTLDLSGLAGKHDPDVLGEPLALVMEGKEERDYLSGAVFDVCYRDISCTTEGSTVCVTLAPINSTTGCWVGGSQCNNTPGVSGCFGRWVRLLKYSRRPISEIFRADLPGRFLIKTTTGFYPATAEVVSSLYTPRIQSTACRSQFCVSSSAGAVYTPISPVSAPLRVLRQRPMPPREPHTVEFRVITATKQHKRRSARSVSCTGVSYSAGFFVTVGITRSVCPNAVSTAQLYRVRDALSSGIRNVQREVMSVTAVLDQRVSANRRKLIAVQHAVNANAYKLELLGDSFTAEFERQRLIHSYAVFQRQLSEAMQSMMIQAVEHKFETQSVISDVTRAFDLVQRLLRCGSACPDAVTYVATHFGALGGLLASRDNFTTAVSFNGTHLTTTVLAPAVTQVTKPVVHFPKLALYGDCSVIEGRHVCQKCFFQNMVKLDPSKTVVSVSSYTGMHINITTSPCFKGVTHDTFWYKGVGYRIDINGKLTPLNEYTGAVPTLTLLPPLRAGSFHVATLEEIHNFSATELSSITKFYGQRIQADLNNADTVMAMTLLDKPDYHLALNISGTIMCSILGVLYFVVQRSIRNLRIRLGSLQTLKPGAVNASSPRSEVGYPSPVTLR